MTTPVHKLSGSDLIDEFEQAVKVAHYDPMGSTPSDYSSSELRAELRRRLNPPPRVHDWGEDE